MNVFVAVFVCTTIFFLIFKANTPSGPASALPQNPAPVASRTNVRTAVPELSKKTPAALLPKETSMPVRHDSSALPPGPEENSPAFAGDDRSQQSRTAAARSALIKHDSKDTRAAELAPDPLTPIDPSHIRIYGDMIDPKQGMIYNTKETIGAPLNAQMRSGATWMDGNSETKKSTADSLKSILSPEVKEADNAADKKTDKKPRGLFRGRRDKAAESHTPDDPGKAKDPAPNSGTDPGKDEKPPADMPQ